MTTLRTVRHIAGRLWVSAGLVLPAAVEVDGATGGAVCLTHADTGVTGYGHDLPAAIDDFRTALIEHRDVLERARPLSADLQRQLAVLNRHLGPRL